MRKVVQEFGTKLYLARTGLVEATADKQITREQAVLLRKERESAGDLPDLFCPV